MTLIIFSGKEIKVKHNNSMYGYAYKPDKGPAFVKPENGFCFNDLQSGQQGHGQY